MGWVQNGDIVKKSLALAAVVVASLALSACGSSPAARKASLDAYVGSLGASPNLQATFTADFTGAKAAKVHSILKLLSFEFKFSNPNGGNLESSSGANDTEIISSIGGKTFVDARDVSGNLYFNVNVDTIATIPGVNLTPGEVASVQLAFGGRWFELKKSVLNGMLPASSASKAKAIEDSTTASAIIDDLTNLLDTTPYKSLGQGSYSVSGTLLSVDKAIYPTIKALSHVTAPSESQAQGTYKVTISTSGSSATAASIAITAPNGSAGNSTATISSTFAHANDPVTAPSGATALTSALLQELFGAAATS